jgi:hypothetical protein
MSPGKATGFMRMDVHAALISTEASVDTAALA